MPRVDQSGIRGTPPSLYPLRPHSATNLGQPYLIIIWMGTTSKRIRRANRSIAARYRPVRRLNTVHLFRAQRGNRCAHQLLDMALTLSILDWQGACGAITGRGLLLSAKFCIKVAARQLK